MIKALRILPPLAIGRLGSADEPLDNYTLADPDPAAPLGYRKIVPAATLRVGADGGIVSDAPPRSIAFKTNGRIRPVAPFLEVFSVDEEGELAPLTRDDVRHVSWRVLVANRKAFRRTGDKKDRIWARVEIDDHKVHPLRGRCDNFMEGKRLGLGHVRFIRPNKGFPQIRLRFTPAEGRIYGPASSRKDSEVVYRVPETNQVYDRDKGSWWLHGDETHDADKAGAAKGATGFRNETVPPSLFAIYPPAPPWLYDNKAVGRGYLDDSCDGVVEIRAILKDGRKLKAAARIVAAPPALAPDSLFIRTLADDLEQAVKGPVIEEEDAASARATALDVLRRAYETVRFMNMAIMNGNDFKDRPAMALDSMPEEEAAGTERAIRPVMAPGTVDTFAIMTLHQQIYAALRAGAAPWFAPLLRRPDQVADFTDYGRRKMPALMCGADNNYLALTWRQIDAVTKAAHGAPDPADSGPASDRRLTPRNRTAKLAATRLREINHAALGNPVSSRPAAAVANCCPGLEMDFRAVWRRLFKGIVLREYDNLVVETDSVEDAIRSLRGRRLLRVYLPQDPDAESSSDATRARIVETTTPIRGPASSDPDGYIVETTQQNPHGLAPLEWSNALARVMRHQGETLRCDFSDEPSWDQQAAWTPDTHVTVHLEVRHFFEDETAMISRALARAGELTQGLCSPWQNDFRECSCYYWASARPDYVNVELGEDGLSQGDNWMQRVRSGSYVPDDYADTRLLLYDDLFEAWEKLLKVQIGGRDMDDPPARGAGSKR